MAIRGLYESDDWVRQPGRFLLYWAGPVIIIIVSACFAEPSGKTWAWVVALVWMGCACLINAWRCARRHCYYTGPFLIIMAFITWLYGSGLIELGVNGWWWLGLVIGIGSGCLWLLPERRWGQYATRQKSKS